MIEAVGVDVALSGRRVLTDVSFATPGRVTGIIGPNGSGKSTLIRALTAAIPRIAGSVTIDDVNLAGLSRHQIAQRVAVVEQSTPSDLDLCVFESVALGRLPWRRPWSVTGSPSGRRADDELVAEALSTVGMDQSATLPLTSLSGGERQRVRLARALVQGAAHLLLDEPTNHLDIRYQHETLALARERTSCVVVVLHDINLAARYCDHLVVLDRGRVVASGPPEDVLHTDLVESVWDVRTERLRTADGCPHIAFVSSSGDLSSPPTPPPTPTEKALL